MPDCELLETCPFFKKYAKTHTDVCLLMIADYCRGDKQSQCKRKLHQMKHNEPPPENMLPGGSILRLDDRIFCRNSDMTDTGEKTEHRANPEPERRK